MTACRTVSGASTAGAPAGLAGASAALLARSCRLPQEIDTEIQKNYFMVS